MAPLEWQIHNYDVQFHHCIWVESLLFSFHQLPLSAIDGPQSRRERDVFAVSQSLTYTQRALCLWLMRMTTDQVSYRRHWMGYRSLTGALCPMSAYQNFVVDTPCWAIPIKAKAFSARINWLPGRSSPNCGISSLCVNLEQQCSHDKGSFCCFPRD